MKGDARWRGREEIQHNYQLANERQPGGEVDKRRRHIARWRRRIERTRGGSGAPKGAMQQPAPVEQKANGGEGISGQGG
jgi:hypothetical protein